MKEKRISQDDLRKLLRLTRLTNEIVKLQIEYIKQGFGAKEIANTFAKIYSKQFERLLTPEVAAKIGQNSPQQSPPCNSNATIHYFLALSGEIMKVITERLKKRK
ncbi:MAG: hypothetical protein US31_C0006G0058 [Berkelbacteria bacterium GW2011_GWA1_36_9]|uniref:Uncharacterized protein n=1 Tax=Berkelbacteria bacterium GW2011_GWA1_36_9 TaxID=1618331 RepID=A0A0G0FKN0_9BACT|nr:MAG: hypothetical protein US31_C0006G0058 [Berkelbacteria bacterium GW2011_GWA1_36_9]